jgi:hypothetical protein
VSVRTYVAWCACGAAALVGLSPAGASAQERQEVLVGRHRNYQSPQNFAFELRFSLFTPDIDKDPTLGGATPYATAFGTSPQALLAVELDWQAARIPHVGSIGPGVGVGYTPNVTGNAQFVTPHNGTTVSGETTTLQIVPVYAVGVLRADALWRELGVPLVPYAKFGPAVGFWRASNTIGTSHAQGVSGLGHSVGTQLAFGLAFNLNVLDENAARNFDETLGVNNTYIFGEWSQTNLEGLWFQKDPLRVGGTYWTFGLTLEF